MNYSACGHMIGDSFELDGDGIRIPDGPSGSGFCYFAVAAVAQLVAEHGGDGDWLARPPQVMCPDPPEGLRMRLEEISVGKDE